MKKKILLVGAVVSMAAAAVTGYSAYSKTNVSDLLNANVEALAHDETDRDGALWSNGSGTRYCCGPGNVRDCDNTDVPRC